jgi:hypothetical protein
MAARSPKWLDLGQIDNKTKRVIVTFLVTADNLLLDV